MADMADNAVLKWAISVIAEAPPMQNVVAFLIVLILAAPLMRAGWRAFRTEKPAPPVEAVAHVVVDPGWLYTTLINTDLKIEQLRKDVAAVAAAVAVVDKILRRKASKARK